MEKSGITPAEEFLELLYAVLPRDEVLPLHEPNFEGNEAKYVNDCVSSGWVSSIGKYVDQLNYN